MCRLTNQEFYCSFLWCLEFWILKTALAEYGMYTINYMAQLTFCHFHKFSWTYWIFRLRGNHLDFPEHILMVASDRLIHDLEAVIKEKKSCSWNPGTFFTNYAMGAHFQVKLRSEACHLDFQNYIPQQAVWKELLWNMHNMKVSGGVCVLKIAGIYSLTGALKTYALLFQFFFKPN